MMLTCHRPLFTLSSCVCTRLQTCYVGYNLICEKNRVRVNLPQFNGRFKTGIISRGVVHDKTQTNKWGQRAIVSNIRVNCSLTRFIPLSSLNIRLIRDQKGQSRMISVKFYISIDSVPFDSLQLSGYGMKYPVSINDTGVSANA